MKLMSKMCRCAFAVFCAFVLFCVHTGTVFAYERDDDNISVCVAECGAVIGAAGLFVDWDCSEGNYVGPENYSVLYLPNNNNGSTCSFDEFDTNGYSNGWSYVQCKYLAVYDDCAVRGKIYCSADTYLEEDNYNEIIIRRCTHPFE